MARTNTTVKTVAALFALTATLLAALATTFLMLQSVFPWMTVLNPREVSGVQAQQAGTRRVDVTNGGPTLAEVTLRQVMKTSAPALDAGGWSEVRSPVGVPGMSFGFGCDPTDGLAPVVAEARSWVKTRSTVGRSGGQALEVSARAYPAGGGAVAFAGVTSAVLRCDAASLYGADGVGLEVAQVVASKSSSLVWRRGDVLMVGTVAGTSRSLAAHMDTFRRFDQSLKKALADTCVDSGAGRDDAARSPYVNRDEFAGHSEVVTVKRVRKPGQRSAEDVTEYPVVKIPGPSIEVTEVVSLPTPPVPAITEGPTALPVARPVPVEPVAPASEAVNSTGVKRAISDPAGPGCGWQFTGQKSPTFDSRRAEIDFEEAVRQAKRDMARAWRQWQDAKLAYYRDYAAYENAAQRYKRYARKVARVQAAWAVVDAARADYSAALQVYETAVSALESWREARQQARRDYRDAKKACRNQPSASPSPQPSPSASPSATATAKPNKPTGPSPTSQPSATPTSQPTPTMVCPPVRPQILDAERPIVPASPTPAPEAQLPPSKKDQVN